jgi:N-acetylglutamate synthase-like GNAT family acetyltransferase
MDSRANPPPIEIRPATAEDQLAIRALVRSEHLNPLDLDWRRFTVAFDGSGLVGAVQLRKHSDGSRELGSLVVRPDARHRGIASQMIDALLSSQTARVFTITRPAFVGYYARWGFRRIEPDAAPMAIWRNYLFGRFGGGLLSLLAGRRPAKLVVLDRYARVAQAREPEPSSVAASLCLPPHASVC